MRKTIMFLMVLVSLMVTTPILTQAADGDFSLQPIFGKVTYSDADSNGFSDATLMGLALECKTQWTDAWETGFKYSWASSYDALTVAPGWEAMDPSLEPGEEGKLTNQKLLLGGTYRFSEQFGLGMGYFVYRFTATEPGYRETRNYSGLSLMGDFQVPDLFRIGILYAPSLSVSDRVKGDWNDPDRTASADYSGSYWELSAERNFTIRDNFRISIGMLYSRLEGEGKDHPDYRFLSHTYTEVFFTSSVCWRF